MTVAEAEQLLAHIERHLGPMDEGAGIVKGRRQPFSIIRVGESWITWGISLHVLELDGQDVAQEIVLTVDDELFARGALLTIGKHVVKHHEGLPAGQTHGLRGFDKSSAIDGAVCVPDERLPPFEDADPPVTFVRLMPISTAELHLVHEHGWRALLDELERAGADTSDVFREPLL